MIMIMRFAKAHKSAAVFCGGIALLLLGAACSQQQPADTRAADEDTIRNLDMQWSKTAASKDVDGSVAFYAADASVLPPNGPIVADKKGIRDMWAGLLGSITSLSWQPTKVEVARSSDIAYTMGTYQLAANDAQGKPTTDKGKYVEVWKKQADGGWKVVADIFNSDLPAAAPPAAMPAPKKKM
jgi:ketosteroid isomerase-like protein